MKSLFTIICGLVFFAATSQTFQEINETKKEYIKEHHLEDVENIVHELAKSKQFLEMLLESGHDFDIEDLNLKRKDVNIGEDIDLFVKHISEHQTFSMLLLPISFYSLGVYDTILFTSLEVSDEWLEKTFEVKDPDNNTKERLLAEEGHRMLEQHIMGQASSLLDLRGMGEVDVTLHESYVTGSHVSLDVSELSNEERKAIRKSWGLLKRVLTHNVNLNVELNVYVFGVDDMDVTFSSHNKTLHFQANPSNVFQRHHFVEANARSK